MDLNDRESRTRDLLPKLMSGEIRLKEAEEFVQATDHQVKKMITEDQLEQLCLGWFRETGYEVVYGPDISPGGAPA